LHYDFFRLVRTVVDSPGRVTTTGAARNASDTGAVASAKAVYTTRAKFFIISRLPLTLLALLYSAFATKMEPTVAIVADGWWSVDDIQKRSRSARPLSWSDVSHGIFQQRNRELTKFQMANINH
jgi:hypothetical protein